MAQKRRTFIFMDEPEGERLLKTSAIIRIIPKSITDEQTFKELADRVNEPDGYDRFVREHDGELIKLGGKGHSFNPFKGATDEQVNAFLTEYCKVYPDEFKGIVREKLEKEIKKIREGV